MNKHAIFHQMDSNYAFLTDMNTLVIRLRVAKNDIRECILYYQDRCAMVHIPKMLKKQMEKVASDTLFDYFEVKLINSFKRVYYGFFLKNDYESVYYINGGFYNNLELFRTKFYQYAYIRENDIVQTPQWAKESIMYQIFPDSFANSKLEMTIKPSTSMNSNGFRSEAKLGGTLKGITENLDYLVELGITAIYMTPVFKSNSYHKYDIFDYFDIDEHLGDKKSFKELVEQCHAKGIRVILDGVFNHTSINFFAFDDVIKMGELSEYKEWFLIHDFPVQTTGMPNYEAFAYVASMPRTNTAHPDVVTYFCNVGKYWIENFGIDGWRLDVANEIDHDFLRQFRQACRSVKSDIFIIGEVWEDAHSFLQGDQFDSVMNYPYAYYLEEFFKDKKITVSQLDEALNGLRMRYKQPIEDCMMNFLDSHDVRRFKTECDVAEFKLAVTHQMTYPGVPCVYYGDELGFEGITEDEYRQPMQWNYSENSMYMHYKALIQLRKTHKALAYGTTRTLLVDNMKGIYVYERSLNNETYFVLLNTNNSYETMDLTQLKISQSNKYNILFGNITIEGTIFSLEPYESCIIQIFA